MEETRLDDGTAAELIHWRPPLGVLSVYVDGDPADRSGRWRIELRNGLHEAVEAASHSGRDVRSAVQATAARIEHTLADAPELPARGVVSFVEIAPEPAETRTFDVQVPLRRTAAFHGERPWVGPLLALVEDGAPLGIAAISAERVRVLDWTMGRVSELHDWGLELYLDDWRERKAPRVSDPASAQAVSASGRDQHNQRMEANRERFARQTGHLAQASAHERGWHRLITFGDERYSSRFADGFSNSCELRFVDASDLIGQPARRIVDRVGALLPELRRERELALVKRLDEMAYANGRAAFGRQATMQALEAGRVDRLVYDSRLPGLEVEQMIELAVPSGAAVTALGDEAAPQLDPHGGVAALLRY
jgi:hypothetical protein